MQFASYYHSGSPGSVCGACLHSWRSAIDDFQRGTSVLLPADAPKLGQHSQNDSSSPRSSKCRDVPNSANSGYFGSRPFQPFNCIGPRP